MSAVKRILRTLNIRTAAWRDSRFTSGLIEKILRSGLTMVNHEMISSGYPGDYSEIELIC